MFQAATTHSAPVATNGRALSTNDPVKSGAYGGDGGDAFDDYDTRAFILGCVLDSSVERERD